MNNLKLCPFCGAIPFVINHEERDGTLLGWYTQCEGCECTKATLHLTKEEAIQDWNRRYDELVVQSC